MSRRTAVMMDPVVKVAMVLCILLGGVCASKLLHRDRPPAAPPDPRAEELVMLEYRAKATARMERESRIDQPPAAPRRRPPPIVVPSERRESPPSLASDYPEAARAVDSGGDGSMKMVLPVDPPASLPTTHIVVDGDTLPALAQRYLGSSARAQELLDANRDALRDPSLLPIGVELKIPRPSPSSDR